MHDMWENLPPRKNSRVRSPLKISLTKSLTLIHHFTRFCSNRSVYAWTYAPMQPHKIDHESIRIHPPWTPLIHHCWSSSLISNLSFNQNHDPTPPTKNPSLNLLNMRNSSTNSPIEIALASEGRFSASGKNTAVGVWRVCFFFFFFGWENNFQQTIQQFFFWKKCPTRPTIRVPAFLGLSFLVAT